MNKYLILCFIFLITSLTITAQSETEKPFSIGEIINIDSKILAEKRLLNIYLPPGYQKNDTTNYPVIYLLDGSADEDFIHIAGLVQFFNMAYKMPAAIIVGIANIDRRRDFTFPTKLKDLKRDYPTTGGSQNFIAFLETELQPFIEKKYKTNAVKMLIGQSLGGLLASEILLKKPALFTNYIIVSPSLWWDNESLLKQATSLLTNQQDIKLQVYISVGTEGKIMERDAKKLWNILNKLNRKNLKLDFVPLPDENHATILHESVYEAFKILYPYKE
ncbi:MAG TPA: alpha/beta hydrolase-fold protein [Ferruginibacter sp.]|nr:alpha/beta hydrolase-fold protein [Ferruginibacter sp.]